MSVFTPNLYLHRITDVTPELLRLNRIRGLILDVDNTLTHHGSQEVTQKVLDWLQTMREHGIQMMIASNNSERRIRPFAQKLGLDYLSMSCKPMTFAFTRACRKFGLETRETALIGDQIYTDILGGNLKGLFTILVEPFEMEDGFLLRCKRRMEQKHLRGLSPRRKGGKRP